MRTKGDGGLEDRAMEQDDGFGVHVGGLAEVVDVAVRAQAADDGGAGWDVHGVALGRDRNFAVVTDADAGLLAPDKGPPRTGWHGTQDGAFVRPGLLPRGVWGGAQFAVEFMLVDVRQELVEQAVGAFEFADLVGGQQGREAFLPVVVTAFDFAFGLGRWRIEQVDAVEVKGFAQLGKGVGVVGVEKRVEIHIESQWKAVDLEYAGQEVQVRQERFARVEAGAGVVTRGVVQEVQQGLFIGGAGQPGMGAGIVLPERAVVASLPAFDGFGCGFVARVGGQLVFQGPAANAGAVGFKIQPAMQFAGGGAVGGGRLGGKEFGEQQGDFVRPVGVMIAAGKSGRPNLGLTLGAGAEVLAVEFVEARSGQAQLPGRVAGRKFFVAMAGQEMTDDGGRQAFDQL